MEVEVPSKIQEQFASMPTEEENALNRVASLPVVASTWNALQNYYSTVKKTYPNVTPYLEVAENLTMSAANMALTTSRPVVDKFGPTVNSYANKGLDKLEDKVPLITKHPEEVYEETKAKATNLLTDKVNNALSVTEDYVDYYLPGDAEDVNDVDEEESDLSEDDDDNSFVDEEHEKDEVTEKVNGPRERIRIISTKVRQRSYKRAMNKWKMVQTRSQETLSRLHFTVDLIEYAQKTLHTVAFNNQQRVVNGVSATVDGLQSAADAINQQVEQQVLSRARSLSGQLNKSCMRAVEYVQNSPSLHHLLDQAKKARDTAEDLYVSFAGKSSLSQLSDAIAETARPKIKFVEETLLQVLETLADQPPVSWITPRFDVDPFGGIEMGEIEAQLYDRPRHDDDVENRQTSPIRKQG